MKINFYVAAAAEMASQAGASTSADDKPAESARQNNLQRIQQRKQQVYNWQHSKKVLKLAIYSACQVNIIYYIAYSRNKFTHTLNLIFIHLTQIIERQANKNNLFTVPILNNIIFPLSSLLESLEPI
jgi:uncharacterized membrane protein